MIYATANNQFDDNNYNFGDFWDLIIAIITTLTACAIINFMSSCSRKTTSVVEDTTDTNMIVSSGSVVGDTTNISIDFNSISKKISESQAWWNAHIIRRSYAYDSLGNQFVTSEESIDMNGGAASADSCISNTTAGVEESTIHNEQKNDTLLVKKYKYTVTKYVKTIPAIWRYSAYFGWCSLIFFTIILLIKFFRKKIFFMD